MKINDGARARARARTGKVSMEMSHKFTSDEITRLELNIYRRCYKLQLSETTSVAISILIVSPSLSLSLSFVP